MFETAFRHLLKGDEVSFINISSISETKLDAYDAIIVGGGDVMNDFYGLKYREALAKYTGYKIALGVGFSFQECLTRDYVEFFDDIILRSQADLRVVSRMLGSKHVGCLPDLGFSIPFSPLVQPKTGKKVGVFLVGSLINNSAIMFTIMSYVHWLISNDFQVELIPMYTEEKIKDNDAVLNAKLYETFGYTGAISCAPALSLEEFFDKVASLDYAICVRFHSMVFCTRAGVPFVSLPLTRKVELYNAELPEKVRYEIKAKRDHNNALQNFDLDNAKYLFTELIKNRDLIQKELRQLAERRTAAFETLKVATLVHNAAKRRIFRPLTATITAEQLYQKYRKRFLAAGINPATDAPFPLMSREEVHSLADELCYEITQDTSNDYSYGTRLNMETKLHQLRDMIYYIYCDYNNKVCYPKLNLTYLKQDSFKGLHRAGWQYSIEPLYYLADDFGVFLDTYCDRTFGWAGKTLQRAGILPYTNHWLGFIHHTFDTAFSSNNCTAMFASPLFQASLPVCKGLFCLTEYLAQQVRVRLAELGFTVPVNVLTHPTAFTSHNFSLANYQANPNKMLINVGSWYRNPISIHRLEPVAGISYAALRGKKMEANFPTGEINFTLEANKLVAQGNIWAQYLAEYLNHGTDEYAVKTRQQLQEALSAEARVNLRSVGGKDLLADFIARVQVLHTLPDSAYDKLLSENIVFLDLVDASVANTVIECIVRNTPLVVNRIPPTEEMLGVDYPLFYRSLDEVPALLTEANILRAHEYIQRLDHEKYRIDHFTTSFVDSEIYRSL